MTVEMSTRVTKVKEEVEETKPEFHHPQQEPSDHNNVRIKEEGGLVDNACHGCGQIIHDQWLLKVCRWLNWSRLRWFKFGIDGLVGVNCEDGFRWSIWCRWCSV